jgi:hypothetical protein
LPQSSSGSLKPGRAGQKIKEAGRYLDLPVIDHLIITGEDSYIHSLMKGCYSPFFNYDASTEKRTLLFSKCALLFEIF